MNTQQLWQAQALDAPRISLVFVRQQSDALRRRTQMRNAYEYLTAAAGFAWVVWTGWPMLVLKPLMMVSGLLWFAGGVVWALRWHRFAAAQNSPGDLGVLDALKFHRRQLERQRDARRANWRWLLLPVIPGLTTLFIALVLEFEPIPWMVIGTLAAWIGLGFAVAIGMYERSARRLQQEIDALDTL